VAGDEAVQRIEFAFALAVQFDDAAVCDPQAGRGIVRAVEQNEARLGPRVDERIVVDGAASARQ